MSDIQEILDTLSPEARAAYECPTHFLKHCQSKPLTFGELKPGDSFICFPIDGDDDGHGGFRAGSWLFRKFKGTIDGPNGENSIRLCDGVITRWNDSDFVIKVS